MPIRAILFDLEGTIINSETLWFQAAGNILAARNIPEDPTFQSRIIGTSLEQVCAILKELHQLPDSLQEIARLLYKEFAILHAQQIPFFPGFLTFFNAIRAHGMHTAIGTNTPATLVHQIRTTPTLITLFGNHIYTPESVNNKIKPAPDLYLMAAKNLDVAPENCLVIEDSIPGVTAAKRASMQCIRLNTTIPSLEILAGEDLVVTGYPEIPLAQLLQP
ncbi:HAD family phosphatase [Methylicorpusculum sp.]|uniref:HAD family hydrolase n=1 Tax=Methylicorpusculum sp. TaxID=2713644 RepID=UPI002AB93AEF|nr:HAD family phosphatase [Methylicorpusculum sp.]MDZ4149546.1 HAD family phosphatase [Methylicorpusculum sp.]